MSTERLPRPGVPTRTISPEKAAELGRLNAELLIAQQRVIATLQARVHPLKGSELAQHMDAERKLSKITRRIRKLHGE